MAYVEKLVVILHETFSNSKRVFNHPPFRVKEEGYAGFMIDIEIYFKGFPSGDNAKMVKLGYDLYLTPDAKLVTEGKALGINRENQRIRPQHLNIHHKNKNFLRIFEEGRKSRGSSTSQILSTPSKTSGVSHHYH